MERSTPWLVAVVCALVGGGLWLMRMRQVGAAPKQDPHALVQKAWTEGRRVALEGRQEIRMPGEGGKPLQVEAEVLSSADGRIRIRYLSRPLEGVTVWEDGKRTYRYNPQRKRLTVAHARKVEGEAPELQLLANYNVKMDSCGQVAGRKAVTVEMRPKSEHGRWKRIWIDPATSVILASEDYGQGDQLLRSTRFTQVRYLSAAEAPETSAFRPSEDLLRKYGSAMLGDTGTPFEPDRLSRLIGFAVHQPQWLPPGYRFRGGYLTPCSCARPHQAARLEYWDGLNAISVFECGHPDCLSTTNCFARGADADLAVRYEHNDADGRTYFLAVGDAPREDLEKLVRSTVRK